MIRFSNVGLLLVVMVGVATALPLGLGGAKEPTQGNQGNHPVPVPVPQEEGLGQVHQEQGLVQVHQEQTLGQVHQEQALGQVHHDQHQEDPIKQEDKELDSLHEGSQDDQITHNEGLDLEVHSSEDDDNDQGLKKYSSFEFYEATSEDVARYEQQLEQDRLKQQLEQDSLDETVPPTRSEGLGQQQNQDTSIKPSQVNRGQVTHNQELGQLREANEATRNLLAPFRTEVASRLDRHNLPDFALVSYKEQEDLGTTYFAKMRISTNEYVHIRVYKHPYTKSTELTGLEADKTLEDTIDVFATNTN